MLSYEPLLSVGILLTIILFIFMKSTGKSPKDVFEMIKEFGEK